MQWGGRRCARIQDRGLNSGRYSVSLFPFWARLSASQSTVLRACGAVRARCRSVGEEVLGVIVPVRGQECMHGAARESMV